MATFSVRPVNLPEEAEGWATALAFPDGDSRTSPVLGKGQEWVWRDVPDEGWFYATAYKGSEEVTPPTTWGYYRFQDGAVYEADFSTRALRLAGRPPGPSAGIMVLVGGVLAGGALALARLVKRRRG